MFAGLHQPRKSKLWTDFLKVTFLWKRGWTRLCLRFLPTQIILGFHDWVTAKAASDPPHIKLPIDYVELAAIAVRACFLELQLPEKKTQIELCSSDSFVSLVPGSSSSQHISLSASKEDHPHCAQIMQSHRDPTQSLQPLTKADKQN